MRFSKKQSGSRSRSTRLSCERLEDRSVPSGNGIDVVSHDPNDWPMYNHDATGSRHNQAEHRLSSATVGDLGVRWSFPTDGPIAGTPAVVNDRIYAADATGVVYALDRDGGLLWRRKLNVGPTFSQNPRDLPSWERAIDEGRLPVWRGMNMDDDDLVRADVIQQLMCLGEIDVAQTERRHMMDFREYFAHSWPQLELLERDGLVSRAVHAEVPPRVEYALTPLGRTLLEPVDGLVRWVDVHGPAVLRNRAAAPPLPWRAARSGPRTPS